MHRITEEEVEQFRQEARKVLRKTYERVLDDPILIPLTWRIWTMLAVAGWTFWNLVLDPVVWVMTRGTPKMCQMDGTFICIGVIATSLCLLVAVRAMRKKRGTTWNKWLKKGDK